MAPKACRAAALISLVGVSLASGMTVDRPAVRPGR